MASCEMDAMMGTISNPMASPAAPALKTLGPCPRNSGQWSCSSGVMKENAKKPNATVGTPSSTSRMGLTILRTQSGAYSLR